jgi:hypothetical protein
MWMPAASVEDEYPGDSWIFKLNKDDNMMVCGKEIKKFKARNLVVAVTDIEPQWRFDPCKFLAFHQGPMDVIKVPIKFRKGVGYYNVLLDTRYAGKFFNYGIEVNSYNVLEVLGIGFDGTFKLTNKERKHVHDVRGRVCIILKYLFIRHPEILERIGDKLAAIDLQNCVREEDLYEDKDFFQCLRKAAQKWKSNIQKECVFLIDERWDDAQKNVIVNFGYFLLPVKGFLGMDVITLLRMHLKMEWKDSPGSFQKVTTASTLNRYEILRWAPTVANIPNVVISKSDNLKIVFVVGDPSILEINLQLARDDPETAATIMANWFQYDKSQGNKRACSEGNTYSEIITSGMSPKKKQLCIAKFV